jgi:ubiquinone/menaquinone biosynthesis C-methylase UbiE
MEDKTAARRAHNLAQQQAFDDIVASFEQTIPGDILQRLDLVVQRAEIHPGDAVLDVGTGVGVLLLFILKHNPSRVMACDLSEAMLERVSAKFGDRLITLQADVVDIPQDEGPFNVVLCNAMFGNVYDQAETLEAIDRLLSIEGRLVISHPMGSAFVRRLKESSPELDLKDLPDERTLEHLLKGTGLALAQFTDEPDLYLATCVKSR